MPLEKADPLCSVRKTAHCQFKHCMLLVTLIKNYLFPSLRRTADKQRRMKPSQLYKPVVNQSYAPTFGCIFINHRQFGKPVLANEFHPLTPKICSFQGSCERTRTESKLMPAADVHKLASFAPPRIKTGKVCTM